MTYGLWSLVSPRPTTCGLLPTVYDLSSMAHGLGPVAHGDWSTHGQALIAYSFWFMASGHLHIDYDLWPIAKGI